jgi:hypothetical protein
MLLGVTFVSVAVVLGYALWWRRNPSACPYVLRFFVELPRPFIAWGRLREILVPRPGDFTQRRGKKPYEKSG